MFTFDKMQRERERRGGVGGECGVARGLKTITNYQLDSIAGRLCLSVFVTRLIKVARRIRGPANEN